MRKESYNSVSTVQSANDAQNLYFRNTGIKIEFTPSLINFHKENKTYSSLCWVGHNETSQNEIIVLALKIPSNIPYSYKKIEYIPLTENDTVIIQGQIFTITQSVGGLCFRELPCIYSEKYAISVANILTGTNTKDYFWRIGIGTANNNRPCYIWYGLDLDNPNKNVTIPVFAKDTVLTKMINDIIPLNISEIIVKNNTIYQICVEKHMLELKYLCHESQSLPS